VEGAVIAEEMAQPGLAPGDSETTGRGVN